MKKIKSILLSIVVGFSFIVGSNFENKMVKAADKNQATTTITSNDLNIVNLVKKIESGVVTVESKVVEDSYRGYITAEKIDTGFFVTPTKILTSSINVERAKELKVVLNNGKEIKAKLLNVDKENEIALLEVEDFKSPTVLKLGSSNDSKIGDWVISIGTSYDTAFAGSASLGVITNLNKTVFKGTSYDVTMSYSKNLGIVNELSERVLEKDKSNLIVTDALVNVGNNGGPLVNLKGEVVGVIIGKITTPEYEKMGLVLPIDQIKNKIEELSVPKVEFGVTGINVTGNSNNVGVFVLNLKNDSIASKAGVQLGDIITEINGIKIDSVEKINEIKKNIKDKVKIKVIRENKSIELK